MTTSSARAATTHAVLSQDGATISYLTMGSAMGARAVMLVIPGALSIAADYTAFARAPAERFTVERPESPCFYAGGEWAAVCRAMRKKRSTGLSCS
jgi:hypothetical protein